MMRDENIIHNGVEPNENDVLCRKGRQYYDHPGTQLWRALVASKLAAYRGTRDRTVKSTIIDQVTEEIQLKGGRFLGWSSDTEQWYVISDP